ncbi:telomere-associated protein Tap [Streptomyces rishiriensis]|uniref:telomere-associated protein Tap n=1 Tax=Streptomyces rishiriensis TaxID=68264 RepID=UPI000D58FBFC|nr:helix-turn-helix transcriptional regulator [Streptomyces rishiriensis]
MDALFDVDPIPEPGPTPDGLPMPAQQRRLRRECGLSLHQVADACDVSEDTVHSWEQGSTTPRGDTAAVYRNLLTALHARQEGAAAPPQPSPAQTPDWAALGALRHEIPTLAPAPAACRRCQQATQHRVGGHPQHLGTRCPAPDPDPAPAQPAPPRPRTAPAQPPAAAPAPPVQRTPNGPTARLAYPPIRARGMSDGPLAVLEAGASGLIAHLADGRTRSCPADDLRGLLAWAVNTPLGAAPVRSEALPPGPLLVLTPTARARLALPADLPDLPGRHPRSDHPLQQQARVIGWQTDADGLGPWTRLHPSTGDPACDRIHLAVTDWGALHHDAWNLPEHLTPSELAALLGQYTSLVTTPLGTPGACGHQLMRDLRPPAHRHTTTGAVLTTGVRGALTLPVDPAPCEAPPGHQLARHRAEQDALADADIDWWRPPAPDEADRAHVVCLAVNLLHLAGSNEIQVADGPARHVHHPPFDPKQPGSWLVDLSAVPQHPRLPPAFAGTGLAWHTTPAVAYAALRGAQPKPVQGWLRPGPKGPYLNPWYQHLRLARLAVLERLGITATQETPDLLTALASLPHADPLQQALLHALHTTVQDAFAALEQPPTQPDQAALAAWPTPQEPTWRPDLRAAVIANARANLHRKLARTARGGYHPLAVSGDHIVYATRTPHLTEITGTAYSDFRIGISPGHVRPVAVRPLHWYTAQCAQGTNPAQLLKDTCPSW